MHACYDVVETQNHNENVVLLTKIIYSVLVICDFKMIA